MIVYDMRQQYESCHKTTHDLWSLGESVSRSWMQRTEGSEKKWDMGRAGRLGQAQGSWETFQTEERCSHQGLGSAEATQETAGKQRQVGARILR